MSESENVNFCPSNVPASAAECGMATLADAGLEQEPHPCQGTSVLTLGHAIGQEVRAIRRNRNMTIAGLANASGVSISLISKIENGCASPSLTTLQLLGHALSTPLTAFFRSYDRPREVQYRKSSSHIEMERHGNITGQKYFQLGDLYTSAAGAIVEPYLVVITDKSLPPPILRCEGVKFIYLIEGELKYRHGSQLFHLCSGDSLMFHAYLPHGPAALIASSARYISMTVYPQY